MCSSILISDHQEAPSSSLANGTFVAFAATATFGLILFRGSLGDWQECQKVVLFSAWALERPPMAYGKGIQFMEFHDFRKSM